MIPSSSVSYTLPTPSQFRSSIESQIWSDLIGFVTISLGVSLIIFLLSKLAG